MSVNAPPLPFPLPPTFPPGVDPETYQLAEVEKLLKSAVYFPIFNTPNPSSPNKPLPLIPGLSFLLIGVEVNEELHRLEVTVLDPEKGQGLRAEKRVGEPVAGVHIRWMPVPEDFEGAPGKEPPATILNPFCSQRFATMDGQLLFKDRFNSGFRAYGMGRTFPATESKKGVLRIGAVIDILEGLGRFSGLKGACVINGWIAPPHDLALNLMVRLMDPSKQLSTTAPLTPLRPAVDPDPNAVFMFFLGEADQSKPVKLNIGPDGRILGSQVYETLRLVDLSFDLDPMAGPRAKVTEGPIVGSVNATLHFNPLAPTPVSPIQTTDGVFNFSDQYGRSFGTVRANMVEGRAMRTELPGAPMPVFRFGGFGPILGGTGQFAAADGMMTMNSVISVFPRTLSNLYILRFYDPAGHLRTAVRNAWT